MGHGIGVKRNDYHRRNRRRNISTHNRSSGINVPVNQTTADCVQIPTLTDQELITAALADWSRRYGAVSKRNGAASTARKCFNYIRHRQSDWDKAVSRLYGAGYLLAIRRFCDLVTERYEFLRSECEQYYKDHASKKKFQAVKVLKQWHSLTSGQVEDFNAKEEEKPDDPITEEEEIPAYFNALSSLHQERFMYLPPFLKADQIRERRFGENANDNWWEWEAELGLTSSAGRPDTDNGILDNYARFEHYDKEKGGKFSGPKNKRC